MKAKDIQSADDLRAWLKGLPEEQALRVAPLIACRAAMRVLPFWARSKQDDLAALPVFWCSLSGVASHENRATIIKFGRRASQPTAADSSSVALVAYAAPTPRAVRHKTLDGETRWPTPRAVRNKTLKGAQTPTSLPKPLRGGIATATSPI